MRQIPKPPFIDRCWLLACALIEDRQGDPGGAAKSLAEMAGRIGGLFRPERRQQVIAHLRDVADRLEREPAVTDEGAQ